MKVSIRGIYSTGLISLLRELGYELTKLSDKQKERFGIFNEDKEDVFIGDLKDRMGVFVKGVNCNKLIEDLKKILWDSLFIKKDEKNFYEGKYVKIYDNKIHLKIPNISIFEKVQLHGFDINYTIENVDENEVLNELKNIKLDKLETYYIYFGKNSKRILDEYRGKIVETIKDHHIHRRYLSEIVDFSEILLKDFDKDLLDKNIKEYIVRKIDEKGFIYRYHRKLDGSYLKYIEVVKEIKIVDGKIYLKTFRPIKANGLYDGLNIVKEEGDYAITEYLEDSWYFVINYFNKNGELKGRYININTPIEISKNVINYIDLSVDVINYEKIVDLDELNLFYKQGYISERLYNYALEISKNLIRNKLE